MPKRKSSIPSATSIDEPVEPNLSRAFDLVMQLMAIPGKTGQEQEVADCIIQHLRDAGAPARPSRPTTLIAGRRCRDNSAIWRCGCREQRRGPRRLLSAHLDTVPICVGSQPVRQGNIVRSANPRTGLGADDRAGCAVLLSAAIEILDSPAASSAAHLLLVRAGRDGTERLAASDQEPARQSATRVQLRRRCADETDDRSDRRLSHADRDRKASPATPAGLPRRVSARSRLLRSPSRTCSETAGTAISTKTASTGRATSAISSAAKRPTSLPITSS